MNKELVNDKTIKKNNGLANKIHLRIATMIISNIT